MDIMKLNNTFNYSQSPNAQGYPSYQQHTVHQPSVIAHMHYFTFADSWLILKLLQWMMRCSLEASRLRCRDLSPGFGSQQAEGTFHYWWGHIPSISALEKDGAAQLTQRFFICHSDWSAVSEFHGVGSASEGEKEWVISVWRPAPIIAIVFWHADICVLIWLWRWTPILQY